MDGYVLIAKFDKVDGIRAGSDVMMSGIKVGTVVDQQLDRETFLAVLQITVSEELALPEDSAIKVTSAGLLGDKYLSIEPGGAETNLQAGGEFQFTQGSVDLIDLLGKAIYGAGSKDG